MARKRGDGTPRRPRGTGSIRRVKGREGYWRADLKVKGTPFSASGTSPELAWANLQAKISAAGRRVPGAVDPSDITVASYVGAWLERRRLEIGQGLELKSWESHERNLNKHLLPVIGATPLPELRSADLEALYAALLGPPHPLSVKYVRDINGTLRLALRRLPRDFGLPNPAADVDLPRRERPSVQYPLSAQQMQRFWAVASRDRLFALWLLASCFPSRSGELRGLKRSDYDRPNRLLLLRRSLQGTSDAGRVLHEREGGKSAANARVLELDDELVVALDAHLARQDEERREAGREWVEHDLIFTARYGTPIQSGNLLRQFRRLLDAAGVPTHHRVHDLRHTAIQSMLLKGITLPEVSGAAGHASVAVTAAMYAHVVRRVRKGLTTDLRDFYAAGQDQGEEITPTTPLHFDGQARALTPQQIEEAKRLNAEGWTQAQLGAHFGVSPSTINRALRDVTGRRPRERRAQRSQRLEHGGDAFSPT